jgi:hypothetical protein
MSQSTEPERAAISPVRTIYLGSLKPIFTYLAKDLPSSDFNHTLILYLNGDLEGESLLAAIRDDFPTLVDLYSDRALNKAPPRVLRDLVIGKEVQVDRRHEIKLILAVAKSIYDVRHVETAVENMVSASGDIEENSSPHSNNHGISQGMSNFNGSHAPSQGVSISNIMSQRFRNDETKYDGSLDSSIIEYFSEYFSVALFFDLSGPHKLKYFHLIFRGQAKRF